MHAFSQGHSTNGRLPDAPPRLFLQTSAQWLAYFRHNAAHLMPIPWSEGVALVTEEKRAISRSIGQFQLGESSEGNHLKRLARAYAARTGDAAYAEAMDLFIGEEQRHARDLGRFMDLAGIPRAASHWSDSVFRLLRRLSNLEMMLSVLLVAELIANVYYAALREATSCPVLRGICRQILRDEAEHVRFHVERLAQLRARRRRTLGLTQALYRQFFCAACLVVWHGNAAVFRKAGMDFRDFWTACMDQVRRAERLMDPRAYAGFRRAPDRTTESTPTLIS